MHLTTRRSFLATASAATLARCARAQPLAVLTFDDAPRSHREMIAPLLAERGHGATFFVTHRWMEDRENFMTWEEIAEIHEMGFEIGNHSWTHANFAIPRNAARLEGELALVTNELDRVGVPAPTSFAWCGNGFGPEALATLRRLGYRRARRGMQPEIEYGSLGVGPFYDPQTHDPLLMPTTGDAYPDWTLDHCKRVLDRAAEGIVVLQFHGVPDVAHPWVNTPPEQFEKYLQEIESRNFHVIAMRDLDTLAEVSVDDPMASRRYPEIKGSEQELPVEQIQTERSLDMWLPVFRRYEYSVEEVEQVVPLGEGDAERYRAAEARASNGVQVLPYPGGRHPRIGFLDGAIDPLRGTKAGVFLPWEGGGYVVVDLPELITSHLGHLFLAHTHVPTVWNDQNIWLENVDWVRGAGGTLTLDWELPNQVAFGARIEPADGGVDMNLWVRNGLDVTLEGLRTQICVMLKGAPELNDLTDSNKVYDDPVAAVRSRDGDRWVLTAWERAGRQWGNAQCPCLHSDPVLPDCAPDETVSIRGRLWFHEGESIEAEIERARGDLGHGLQVSR